MKKLLFGFLATILLTFTVNAQGTLRANFLKGKTYEQVVTDFNKLTNDEKNDLWIEKMDQVLGEDLPMEHKTILTQVRGLLKKINVRM